MSSIRLFELEEPLVAGRHARARLLKWNGERYIPSRFAFITLHDYVGGHGLPGDRGYCRLSEDSHRWEFLGGLPPRLVPLAQIPHESSAVERAPRPVFTPLSARLNGGPLAVPAAR